MSTIRHESVAQYVAAQPQPARRILGRVRTVIQKALPGCTETIAYNIPTYKLGGRGVLYFAGWKKHFSLYPASSAIVAACERELAPYEVEKGTIRFPYDARLPVHLLQRIAKLRLAEVSGRTSKPRGRVRARPARSPARGRATPRRRAPRR